MEAQVVMVVEVVEVQRVVTGSPHGAVQRAIVGLVVAAMAVVVVMVEQAVQVVMAVLEDVGAFMLLLVISLITLADSMWMHLVEVVVEVVRVETVDRAVVVVYKATIVMV